MGFLFGDYSFLADICNRKLKTEIDMDCQRPVKNKETNKWEVWDFAYIENEERYYELHEFFEYKEAIEFWKLRNNK